MPDKSTRGGRTALSAESCLDEAKSALERQDARSALRSANNALKRATSDLEIARACYFSAAALADLGRLVASAERVASGFHALGDRRGCERALLLVASARLSAEHGQYEDARDRLDEAERELLELDDCPVRLSCVRLFAAQCSMLAGEHGLALERLTQIYESLAEDHPYRANCTYWLSLASGFAGDKASALRWAEVRRDAAEAEGDVRGLFDARLLLARWLMIEEDARAAIVEADTVFEDEPYYRAEARICLAGIQSYTDPLAALEALKDAETHVLAAGSLWMRQSVGIIEARAAQGAIETRGDELVIRLGDKMPLLDVLHSIVERFTKRTALRKYGTASAAGKAIGRTPANVRPRRKRKGSECEDETTED